MFTIIFFLIALIAVESLAFATVLVHQHGHGEAALALAGTAFVLSMFAPIVWAFSAYLPKGEDMSPMGFALIMVWVILHMVGLWCVVVWRDSRTITTTPSAPAPTSLDVPTRLDVIDQSHYDGYFATHEQALIQRGMRDYHATRLEVWARLDPERGAHLATARNDEEKWAYQAYYGELPY